MLLPASLNTVKLLRHMARADWEAVQPLQPDEDEQRQVARILKEHLHFVLDRNVRSTAFMDEVARWRPGS